MDCTETVTMQLAGEHTTVEYVEPFYVGGLPTTEFHKAAANLQVSNDNQKLHGGPKRGRCCSVAYNFIIARFPVSIFGEEQLY